MTMPATVTDAEHARRTLARLASENGQLRKENRHLRRITKNGKAGRILRRAYDDALAMLVWRHSDILPTRRWCADNGITERRWAWARALLCVADLHNGVDEFFDIDLEEAKAALRSAANAITNTGDLHLVHLRQHMPAKYRYQALAKL